MHKYGFEGVGHHECCLQLSPSPISLLQDAELCCSIAFTLSSSGTSDAEWNGSRDWHPGAELVNLCAGATLRESRHPTPAVLHYSLEEDTWPQDQSPVPFPQIRFPVHVPTNARRELTKY